MRIAVGCRLFILLLVPPKLQSLRNHLINKNVLVVGDGDFSFSASLAKINVVQSLVATTWDSKDRLQDAFPKATKNVRDIESFGNAVVEYTVDATALKYSRKFDVVVWNFPHVVGKQNIRRNRELLKNFFISAKEVIKPSGKIFCSLCEGQSGAEAETKDEWNKSWKLIHQVATAGLLLSSIDDFNPTEDFPDYFPQGHRGHGGGFLTGKSKLYTLMKPGATAETGFCMAVQAPVYAHEVHVLRDGACPDMRAFENAGILAAKEICARHGMSDVLWACHLVDVYLSPSTQHISHTFQIAYCSQTRVVDQSLASALCSLMELEMPKSLGLLPRTAKHGGGVSKPYPWYVARALLTEMMDTKTAQIGAASSIGVSDFASVALVPHDDEARSLSAQLREIEEREKENEEQQFQGISDRGSSNSTTDHCEIRAGESDIVINPLMNEVKCDIPPLLYNSQHASRPVEELGHIRAIARVVWRRRVGVINHYASPTTANCL